MKKVGQSFGPSSDVGYFPRLDNVATQTELKVIFKEGDVKFAEAGAGLNLCTVQVDRCGTVITGIPLGSEGFQRAAVERTVEKALAAVTKLGQNKSVSLVAVTKIIQECIIARLSFLGQAVSLVITAPAFTIFDTKLFGNFFSVGGHLSPS